MNRIAVVGGGISGLSAAYYLARSGHNCTLLERETGLGGVIGTEQVDGCAVEAGPDSFLARKTAAMDLIRELGLADDIIPSNDHLRRTYILRKGRLVPLPDGVQFLVPTRIAPMVTTRLLSWRTKLRLALEWFHRRPSSTEDHSVAEFVNAHYGPEAVEYLAQPLLASVYGGSPEELSIESMLPQFIEMERTYGSLTRGVLAQRRKRNPHGGEGGPLFLTLKGGMGQLTGAIEQRLRQQILVVRGDVKAVEPAAGGWRIKLDGDTLDVDQVVLATPAYESGSILRSVDGTLAATLESILYHSSTTAAMIYHRPPFAHPLNGFGFLLPRAEGRHLATCTWVNTKFSHRVPDNRALLRGFFSTAEAERRWDEPEERLAETAQAELQSIMSFHEHPAAWRVHRWDRRMAQYEVGHRRKVEEIMARAEKLPGLHLAGNAYDGIGIPDCIRRSRAIAERIKQGEQAPSSV